VIAPNLQRVPLLDARTRTPDELSEMLTFGDLVVATPTLWRYLAETLPEVPSNVVAVSFGETLTPDLAQKLRQRGLGALRELYGSTETGVVAWRDSQSEPFVLFDHWDRDGDALIRRRPDGRTARLILMDEVEWEGKRGFRLGPRRDGAVQIGAVNVFPGQIGEIIAEHPGVVGCEVRLSRRPGALDRLIADITVAEGLDPDEEMAWTIDEWCRARLHPAERPRIYRFIPANS
jgi:4-coumarate--CoA ligase (photoactive yellow protein activation family)